MRIRNVILCSALVVGTTAVSMPSYAREIVIEVAPPALRVETVPAPRHGYYWAPGYWNWNHNKHVWVNGHWIRERPGYHWNAPRWEEREGHWHFHDGYWER